MATTQRSSLPLPANLRHDLLWHPHAPGLLFLTNPVRVLRAGPARLASVADRRRDSARKTKNCVVSGSPSLHFSLTVVD